MQRATPTVVRTLVQTGWRFWLRSARQHKRGQPLRTIPNRSVSKTSVFEIATSISVSGVATGQTSFRNSSRNQRLRTERHARILRRVALAYRIPGMVPPGQKRASCRTPHCAASGNAVLCLTPAQLHAQPRDDDRSRRARHEVRGRPSVFVAARTGGVRLIGVLRGESRSS